MQRWKIAFANSLGEVSYKEVETDGGRDVAIRLSNIPEARIISVTDKLDVSSLFDFPPPIPDQVTFLAALGSAVSAGQSVDTEFINLVALDKQMNKKIEHVKAKLLTSERMKYLKFDATAVMLCEVGERAATLASSLSTAAQLLTETFKINRELNKGIKPQLMMIAILTAALFGIPYMFNSIFTELTQPGTGLVVHPNFSTHFLFALKAIMDAFWWGFIAIAVAIFIRRKWVWRKIKTKPIMGVLNELHMTQRGVRFISTYITLDYAGVPILEMLERLRDGQKGIERTIFEGMIDKVQKGKKLSEAFDEEYFPGLMLRSMQGMELVDRDKRRETLLLLRSNLITKVEILADKAVGRFKLLGWIFMFTVILNMLVGIYLPLMTISSF